MRFVGYLKWLAINLYHIFPYGLMAALAFLSIGFFVYAPFDGMSLALSSSLAIVSLFFFTYECYSHFWRGAPHEEKVSKDCDDC